MDRVSVAPTTRFEDLPDFLTVAQAAAYTQQSRWTIYQAVHEGRIPRSHSFGRKIILIPRGHFKAPPVTL
jgi:excisionase family DNA binding protein